MSKPPYQTDSESWPNTYNKLKSVYSRKTTELQVRTVEVCGGLAIPHQLHRWSFYQREANSDNQHHHCYWGIRMPYAGLLLRTIGIFVANN